VGGGVAGEEEEQDVLLAVHPRRDRLERLADARHRGHRRGRDGAAAVDERDRAARGAEAAREFALHELDLAPEHLLRAVARDGEKVEVDPARLARLERGERLVEELLLPVERDLDVVRGRLVLAAAREHAVMPHAAVDLAAVRFRFGVGQDAFALVDALLEAAFVEVAVRELEPALAVEAPVLELAFVSSAPPARPARAFEPAVDEAAFPDVAAAVGKSAAALEPPVAEFTLVSRAVLACVAPGAGELALAEVALVHLAAGVGEFAAAMELPVEEFALVVSAVVAAVAPGAGELAPGEIALVEVAVRVLEAPLAIEFAAH